MIIHELPGTLRVEFDDAAKAMIDTWSSYTIKAPQFREAILHKGVSYARSHGAKAWIMDATKAKGAFPQEVQTLIATEVFKTFASIGIKYFITIKSATSAITNMSIHSYTTLLGPSGIKLVEVPDQAKAIEWLKAQK